MNAVAESLNRRRDMSVAPLIDVVFLLLVYFMVTASLVKKEADLSFRLPVPGKALAGRPIEVLVEISAPGLVTIEGERFADRGQLFRRLELLKAVADASQSELSISVMPDDRTRHEKIIPIMDACAAAEIENLSFSSAL